MINIGNVVFLICYVAFLNRLLHRPLPPLKYFSQMPAGVFFCFHRFHGCAFCCHIVYPGW